MTKHARRGLVVVALSVPAIVACVELDGGGGRERRAAPIVGGATESGFPLVGMLAGDQGGGNVYPFCTATPVTPTVLISAAHCLDAFEEMRGLPIVFVQSTPTVRSYPVSSGSRRRHPQWGMHEPNYVNDVGVVSITTRIDADMFPLLYRAPSGGAVGTSLTVVGYGATHSSGSGAGTKRSIPMRITESRGAYFVMVAAENWKGVCYGDSGGPSFVPGEHRDTQYGVHARTQVESCGPAEDTAVGHFYESFVKSAVLALDATADDCGDGVCTGIEDETGCPADCAPYVCGDGTRQGPEVCDDGNRAGGDGCSADCLSDETCGNRVLDAAAGEVCDDGNVAGGDGCSADCRSDEACGNSIVDAAAGEQCDDGNIVAGDGCSADCKSNETCGNRVVDAAKGEKCDDGNVVPGDGCSADCTSNETCGNAVVDTVKGEKCDDGNVVPGDGCAADCKSNETCGNAVVDAVKGEKCDDGNTRGKDGCSADCRSSETCGNGVVDDAVGEACDDGNTRGGDGCSADCRVNEKCGNGLLETASGERCDDGNKADGDGCSADCRSDETCGNGVTDEVTREACDDGNRADGDGCPADCGILEREETVMTGGCGCALAGAPRGTGAGALPPLGALLVLALLFLVLRPRGAGAAQYRRTISSTLPCPRAEEGEAARSSPGRAPRRA